MQRLFAAVLVVACVVGSTRLLADTALILALAIPAVPTHRAFRAQVYPARALTRAAELSER
jgi:hypothetical protein